MAFVIADRVQETSTTTGTGTYTLAGAVTGFQAFSAIGNGNTCYYCATDGTDWEVGIGTYTSSGTTLARTTILGSSNSGNAVDWGAGTKNVYVTAPAESIALVNDALDALSLGAGASATAADCTAIGDGALADNNRCTAIGQGAEAGGSGTSCTAIGGGSTRAIGGSNKTVIGAESNANGSSSSSNLIVIGAGISIGSNKANSVILSPRGTPGWGGDNSFYCGSSTVPITDVYFGEGAIDGTPSDVTYHGTGGSGTDIGGGDLSIAGGKGTGAGAGGSVKLQTAPAGSSGTTLGTLATHLEINSAGLVILPTLPTSDPAVAGALWSNGGVLTVSAG